MSKRKKTPVRELIRLAMVYAQSDRENMAECDRGAHGAEARELAKEFRAYRLKHYGKTSFEVDMENSTLISITDLRKRKP